MSALIDVTGWNWCGRVLRWPHCTAESWQTAHSGNRRSSIPPLYQLHKPLLSIDLDIALITKQLIGTATDFPLREYNKLHPHTHCLISSVHWGRHSPSNSFYLDILNYLYKIYCKRRARAAINKKNILELNVIIQISSELVVLHQVLWRKYTDDEQCKNYLLRNGGFSDVSCMFTGLANHFLISGW